MDNSKIPLDCLKVGDTFTYKGYPYIVTSKNDEHCGFMTVQRTDNCNGFFWFDVGTFVQPSRRQP